MRNAHCSFALLSGCFATVIYWIRIRDMHSGIVVSGCRCLELSRLPHPTRRTHKLVFNTEMVLAPYFRANFGFSCRSPHPLTFTVMLAIMVLPDLCKTLSISCRAKPAPSGNIRKPGLFPNSCPADGQTNSHRRMYRSTHFPYTCIASSD